MRKEHVSGSAVMVNMVWTERGHNEVGMRSWYRRRETDGCREYGCSLGEVAEGDGHYVERGIKKWTYGYGAHGCGKRGTLRCGYGLWCIQRRE